MSRTKVRNPRRGSFRNVTHKYFTHTWLAASIGKPHGAHADFPAAPKRRPPAQTLLAAGVFHP
ncbi:hypothetical protein B9L19_10690 [Geobacillus thermocatenulatus]|uniref:Uncharacterized protein n=1 Tax=Geobacillus thermocatenulatus TaxID=33938 RepID=A0AA91QMR8_9BACL|nr:hypothetical protein B9L19_10690 [Geobacillus thermocatenulatus]